MLFRAKKKRSVAQLDASRVDATDPEARANGMSLLLNSSGRDGIAQDYNMSCQLDEQNFYQQEIDKMKTDLDALENAEKELVMNEP